MQDLRILTFENNVLVPKIADTTVFLSGTPALIQRVIKCLLTIKGQDRFNPEFGASLRQVLPKTYNESLLSKVQTDVNAAIIECEKQIREEDAEVNSPAEERLNQLYLKDLKYDINKLQWVVDLVLKNQKDEITSFGVAS